MLQTTEDIIDLVFDRPEVSTILHKIQEKYSAEQQKREDFFNWISEDTKAEFINGEVIIHLPTESQHAQISDNIFMLFSTYALKHKLGRVTHEKVISRFTRNDYEPDVMFFGKEKSDTIQPNQALFPVPDFVVEVLSDSTEERDRGVKFNDFESHGVAEYWLIDVETETIEQYLLKNGQYYLHKKTDEGVIHCSVLKGLDFPVEAIFDESKQFELIQTIMS